VIGFLRQSLAYFVVAVASLVASVYFSSIWLKPSLAARAPVTIAQVPVPQEPAASPSATDQVTESPSVPTAEPLAAFLEPYLYDTREGRRNPFKASALIEPGVLSNQYMGPATPLERFELDELRLLAIIWDVKNPRAMFLDPTNEVHTIGKDDRIGRRRGYVAVIREGEVVVVESTTYGGEPVYSTRILRMER